MRGTAYGLAAATAWLAAVGCKCAEDKPYTPFHIDAVPSASAAFGPAPSASAAPASPFPRDATSAPKDVSDWTLDGVAIGVDKARVIERAIAADFDGDGAKDAVAWTRARSEPPESATTGELVYFGSKTPAGRVVGKIAPFVPSGPGCQHTVALSQTGDRTVTLDIGAHCQAALLPRSPTRALSIIAPAETERAAVLSLRIADAAPGESFTLAVDSKDRDGDGRDDVRITTSLKSEQDDLEAAADLVWLDRAAGASRDAAEPAHSLGTIASLETVRAPGRTTSQKVPGKVANARRLYATLCAEGGTPRVFDVDGAPLPCSDVGSAMNDLTVAEVRAAIARHDVLAAAASLGRDGWYHGALGPKTRASLEKDFYAAAPKRAVTERSLDVTPRAKAGLPRYSPLAFEPDGSLLAETLEGVVRVRFPEGRAEDASEGVDAWPLTVGTGSDARWTGLAFPCDRSEALLLVSDANGTPLPSRPTRLLAPRPGPCRHGATPQTPSLVPLEWTSDRAIGLIGAGLFGANDLTELAKAPPKGAPRSPDGKQLVAATALGLVVTTATKGEAWSATAPLALSDCVVANGAALVACLRGDRAVTFTPEPAAKK